MKGKTKIYFHILLAAATVSILFAAKPAPDKSAIVDAHSIINDLFKAIDNAKTLTYTMVHSERLDGSTVSTDSSQVKSQKNPHKIFMKMSDGAEVLWQDGLNNGNAWVHPNSFPFVTLELDPDGMIMRKNQHHGVQYAGYDYFKDVLKQAADKAGKNFDSRFLYLGEMVFDGVKCYKIVALDPGFKYTSYQVLKGENILSIAKKLWLNEYMIMQHNNLSSFNDVNQGQTIMVPTDYGKEITLYINKTTMLPLLLRVDDDKGLFEQYTFRHITINPVFPANTFTKENKEYHF